MPASRVEVNRPRLVPALSLALLSLALLTLLSFTACKKTVKPDKPDDTPAPPGGPASGNANNTAGGIIPSLTKPALPDGWREFKHPDGVYSIYVPAQPKHSPMSAPSLELKQPLGPNEARETVHIVLATATQPLTCDMRAQLFDPNLQSVLEQSYAANRPKDDLNHKWLEYRDVTWAGRRAKETVCEKTFLLGSNVPPKRIHQVARYMFTPGRLYTFSIERENQMPTATELAAFFDSFTLGN